MQGLECVSEVIVSSKIYSNLCAFFIRNHLIRSLHLDGRIIYGTYTANKGKKTKELFNFESLQLQIIKT